MAKLFQKVEVKQELRPCMVNGRRALFHRWADGARPVTPRGVEADETTQRYQLYNVHGIVEYEDGEVARVWPSDIRFIDSDFDQYAWPEMEVPF